MAKDSDATSKEKRAAILKELESVRSLLNENKTSPKVTKQNPPPYETKVEKTSQPEEVESTEYQIPLLDPAKPTTYELDFSKPKPAPVAPPPKPKPPVEPKEEDIPIIDDIAVSGSLFDDDEDEDYREQVSVLTQAQLQEHAQLIIQDLLNDAISEIEDKLDEWMPKLEEKLKKRLEKAMDKYIAETLKK